jgi:hypothetical protein
MGSILTFDIPDAISSGLRPANLRVG